MKTPKNLYHAQPAGRGEPGRLCGQGWLWGEEGNALFTACQVSGSSAAGGEAGMEGPTFRVKAGSASNLGTHTGGRAQDPEQN